MSNETYWKELREGREKAGIDLEQISKNTKIGVNILENIEAGNFSDLSETYMRLFLKAYAAETGNNFEELLANTPYSKEREIQKIYALKDTASKDMGDPFKNMGKGFSSKTRPIYIFLTIIVLIFLIYIGKQVMPESDVAGNNNIIDTFQVSSTVVDSNTINNTIDSANTIVSFQTPDSIPDNFSFPMTVMLFPSENIIYRIVKEDDIPREEFLQNDVEHSFTVDKGFDLTVYKANKCTISMNSTILPSTNEEQIKYNISNTGILSVIK